MTMNLNEVQAMDLRTGNDHGFGVTVGHESQR